MTKIVTAMTDLKPREGSESPGNVIHLRSKRALIQWPTGEELEKVSAQLRRINQIGICSEAKGDYFMSGDLAYQLHEIVRTTRELLRKSLRGESQ